MTRPVCVIATIAQFTAGWRRSVRYNTRSAKQIIICTTISRCQTWLVTETGFPHKIIIIPTSKRVTCIVNTRTTISYIFTGGESRIYWTVRASLMIIATAISILWTISIAIAGRTRRGIRNKTRHIFAASSAYETRIMCHSKLIAQYEEHKLD